MQVHLALPGLLWPAKALPDVMFALELPALAWLLGRGRRRQSAALDFETWLARRLGHLAGEPALAALRLLGEEDGKHEPGDADWICADPAHLAFEHGQPFMADPAQLNLQADEIAELAAALSPIFVPVGEFSLHRSGHGYVRLAAATDLAGPPPSAAVGRGATLLPRGRDATRWMRLVNEAQITLHSLALNRRREQDGRPLVNSLWFWGAGRLSQGTTSTVPYEKVGAGGAAATLARGMARHAGATWQENAPDAGVPAAQRTLIIDERLLTPAQQLDAAAWRDALQAIDRERLAPLAAALRRGGLQRFTLTGLGDETTLDLELVAADAWRFWRRPRSLAESLKP